MGNKQALIEQMDAQKRIQQQQEEERRREYLEQQKRKEEERVRVEQELQRGGTVKSYGRRTITFS